MNHVNNESEKIQITNIWLLKLKLVFTSTNDLCTCLTFIVLPSYNTNHYLLSTWICINVLLLNVKHNTYQTYDFKHVNCFLLDTANWDLLVMCFFSLNTIVCRTFLLNSVLCCLNLSWNMVYNLQLGEKQTVPIEKI